MHRKAVCSHRKLCEYFQTTFIFHTKKLYQKPMALIIIINYFFEQGTTVYGYKFVWPSLDHKKFTKKGNLTILSLGLVLLEILTGNYADDFEEVSESYRSVNNYSDSFEESSPDDSDASSVSSEEDIHGVDEVSLCMEPFLSNFMHISFEYGE